MRLDLENSTDTHRKAGMHMKAVRSGSGKRPSGTVRSRLSSPDMTACMRTPAFLDKGQGLRSIDCPELDLKVPHSSLQDVQVGTNFATSEADPMVQRDSEGRCGAHSLDGL